MVTPRKSAGPRKAPRHVKANRRELLTNASGTHYATRRATGPKKGTFKTEVAKGKSLRADRAKKATRIVPPGFGGIGDQKPRPRGRKS